jgi:hypothetical protein
MTEAEAKKHWCPFVRIAQHMGLDMVPVNRVGSNGANPDTCCLASKCMAWRWDYPDGPSFKSTTGHCGLAGRER